MNGNVLYIKRSLFSSNKHLVEQLSQKLNVEKSIASTSKCTILENSDMIIAIRKYMIDVVLLTNHDVKEKKRLYDLMRRSV